MSKEIHNFVGLFPRLTIDDVLSAKSMKHREYRRWLAKNDLPLYTVTPGLAAEVFYSSSRYNKKQLGWRFNLDMMEVNKCLYTDVETKIDNLDGIKEDIKAGKETQESIAHKYGISQARVSQFKSLMGLSKRNKKKRSKITDNQRATVCTMYEEGANVARLAKLFNLAESTIYRILGNKS